MKKSLFLLILSIILPFQVNFAAELNVPASEIMSRVNAERNRAGLSSLSSNSLLTRAAQERARDMMARGYMEHVSPEGRSFEVWVNETGYAYSIVGENLASSVHAASAEIIVSMWMNSPSHRANILSDKYVETGIGVVSGTIQGDPAVIVVQIFASPRGGAQPQPQAQTQPAPAPTSKPTIIPEPIVEPPKTQDMQTISAPVPANPPVKQVVSKPAPPPVKVAANIAVKKTVAKSQPAVQGTSTSEATGVTVSASTAAADLIPERFASSATSPEKPDLWTTFVAKVIQLIHELFR